MRKNALGGVEPWTSAYSRFSNDSYSQAPYKSKALILLSVVELSATTLAPSMMHAPRIRMLSCVYHKGSSSLNRSTTILEAWGTNLTNIIGTDRSLLVGINGVVFANAAEIMRWEGGWVEQTASWKGSAGFSIQLYWLFARQSIIIGQANYGVASIMGLLNFAVYLDDVALYNYALYAYKNDLCAGLSANLLDGTGQFTEAARDQTHVQDGLQWLSMASKVVKNQGYDLFSLDDNLLFEGSEYAAKYNLNETVPYDPSFYRCEAVLLNGPWANISAENRYIGYQNGKTNPACWGLPYYEGISRGLDLPFTKRAKAVHDASVAGQSSPVDLLAWADLLFATKAHSAHSDK
ncbi:chondroitin AC/alginate lyase [Penicillium canescens]|uniref:Chondroitin AC/alginate lyase n=1 Tax=Penicillium canescens TaxID=5083 RepID=A0AAD6ND47_PENCN|nr:chondroitin AC/alginate lyase [Penicillium canescens]KAJ6049772.1 chondroitin AC/alginate lyase [Penicillium canescens]KAJ6052258.1 chondroitin AC/alginate lyase [Penicillium canescens]KAJ6062781.1 chondroitin AC/alginate lyase [Penicillium canescens]KAJ6069753.1 chondroitin AC/alginate lyase [Penicillium canescens]KAJ6182196.1 chondroitin AC/alginate lyase [Penicillium canescens]